jgi:hypothetical protein
METPPGFPALLFFEARLATVRGWIEADRSG